MAIAKYSVPDYLWTRLVSVHNIQFTLWDYLKNKNLFVLRPNSNFMKKTQRKTKEKKRQKKDQKKIKK
jgi:hypothetical protein